LQSSTQFIPSQESKDGEQQIDVQPADITLEGLSTLKDTYNLSDKDSSVRKNGVNETDEALVSSLTSDIQSSTETANATSTDMKDNTSHSAFVDEKNETSTVHETASLQDSNSNVISEENSKLFAQNQSNVTSNHTAKFVNSFCLDQLKFLEFHHRMIMKFQNNSKIEDPSIVKDNVFVHLLQRIKVLENNYHITEFYLRQVLSSIHSSLN
jgi:hypothetical protein